MRSRLRSRWRCTTCFAQIGSTAGTSWHTPTLAPCSSKTYYLAAHDAAGNRSAYTPVAFTLLCAPSISVSASGPGFPAGRWAIKTLPVPFVLNTAQVITTTDAGTGATAMTWPGYGYYWKFTVQCSENLATWTPIAPASQWPSYVTTFTFVPETSVPQCFYRVLATLATP